ncbi:MAG: maleate cis-trans isomerase family protein [Alphaproteobacteria bacterium]
MQNDNWGCKARIGIFIVSSEAVPEAEWNAMMPKGVSVHAARVSAPTPWANWKPGRDGVALSQDLARGAEHFAGMRLSAITTAHTSSSVVGGDRWDAAIISELQSFVANDVIVSTNGRDIMSALQYLAATHPFLVVPPWFGDSTVGALQSYLNSMGVEPSGWLRHDPGPEWNDVPTAEMYPSGLGFAQDVGALYQQIVKADLGHADAILICGTGFRSVSIIEDLEEKRGLPVVTANQASFWNCLRLSGVNDKILGYGRLLRL